MARGDYRKESARKWYNSRYNTMVGVNGEVNGGVENGKGRWQGEKSIGDGNVTAVHEMARRDHSIQYRETVT